MLQYLSDLRQKMAGPDLSTILETTPPPVLVNVRTTVREAAGLMKDNHTTAVLVMDRERIAGIFTSKDVVLRVIAPGYDPSNTSVIRVMTPHPDTAKEDLSIQAALRKMHGLVPRKYQKLTLRWPLSQPPRRGLAKHRYRYRRRPQIDVRNSRTNKSNEHPGRRRSNVEPFLEHPRQRHRISAFRRRAFRNAFSSP